MEHIVNQPEGLENIENFEKREWVIELDKELKKIDAELNSEDNLGRRTSSIYRLPEHVTNRQKEAYKPLVVSIGPYHNEEVQVKAMEKLKLRALHHFLRRSKKSLQSCVNDLEAIVDDLRGAYDNLDKKWKEDTSKFLRMMILDGCFIIEILLGNVEYDDDDDENERSDDDHYTRDNPIFTKHGKIHVATLVRKDMLLIENQVPLLLLEKITHVEESSLEHEGLVVLVLKFCSPDAHEDLFNLLLKYYFHPDATFIKDGKCLHILDVYRRSLISKLVQTAKTQIPMPPSNFYEGLPNIPPFLRKFLRYLSKRDEEKDHSKEKDHNKEKDHIRHSATEMKEAGIKIKCIGKGNQRMSFEGTTLWLPKLFLDDASKSTLLNILAFERFYENAGNELTTYIFFMNKLIKSVGDVRLLKEEEIIYNSMGSDEDAVQLFYQLSREITLDSNTSLDEWYVDISNKINNYHSSNICTWRKWKYNLMSTYFKSPWTFISVLGAAFILGLTATGTVYTILSYVNRETSALPPP